MSRPFGIKYKGLKLLDVPQANIALHFNEVVEFIEEGLEGGGEKSLLSLSTVLPGKVLVNCQMGVSRSSAAVLAYLMMRHSMTAVEALTEVRKVCFRSALEDDSR